MNLLDKYWARLNDGKQEGDGVTAFPCPNDLCFLIDQTLQEINKAYNPGALEWVKTNVPEKWEEIRRTEYEINKGTLEKDTEGLKRVLTRYLNCWGEMVREMRRIHMEAGSFEMGTLPLFPECSLQGGRNHDKTPWRSTAEVQVSANHGRKDRSLLPKVR